MRSRVVALLFLVVIAGCSGDDDDTAVPASTTTARPTTTTTRAPATTTTTVPPEVALAAELTRIEQELRSDNRDESGLAELGRAQDAAYATLRAHPELMDAVLAAAPEVAPIISANVGAAAELTPLAEPQPDFPPWTIRAPLPREELLALYRESGEASGVPWQYLASIHLIESRLGRIVGPSTAGALGPMQFIPSSWEAFGEGGDIYSDRDSILAAGRYLRDAGAEFDIDGALFAYNHSDHYVAAVKAYAEQMIADERAYDGYYYWPVRYRTTEGTFILPEGYPDVPAEPAD